MLSNFTPKKGKKPDYTMKNHAIIIVTLMIVSFQSLKLYNKIFNCFTFQYVYVRKYIYIWKYE